MYFFFSKILFFLVCPVNWVLGFLIAAIIVKKPKLRRGFLITGTAILLFFSTPYILEEFAKWWDVPPYNLKPTDKYSCAIVLGGFVSEDGKGDVYFTESADRFIQAVKLYNEGKVSRILVSGGNGAFRPGKFKEADWAKIQMEKFNIPDSCILTESQSRNTIENAAFSKMVLERAHVTGPYLLVTSAFHMRRSLAIFKKDKIPVVPYPCGYLIGKSHFSFLQCIPDATVFSKWLYYTKEVVGLVVTNMK